MSKTIPFEELIQKDTYQVFLMICPATLPFSIATHPWFVVNKRGIVSRYGISWRKAVARPEPLFGKHVCSGCVGYLHKDGCPPTDGIAVFPYVEKFLWKGHILSSITGEEGSLAARMTDFIEKSFTEYPFSDRYWLLGPNSNTYPAWVLAHFPESNMRLPWNAIGKNFGLRKK